MMETWHWRGHHIYTCIHTGVNIRIPYHIVLSLHSRLETKSKKICAWETHQFLAILAERPWSWSNSHIAWNAWKLHEKLMKLNENHGKPKNLTSAIHVIPSSYSSLQRSMNLTFVQLRKLCTKSFVERSVYGLAQCRRSKTVVPLTDDRLYRASSSSTIQAQSISTPTPLSTTTHVVYLMCVWYIWLDCLLETHWTIMDDADVAKPNENTTEYRLKALRKLPRLFHTIYQ